MTVITLISQSRTAHNAQIVGLTDYILRMLRHGQRTVATWWEFLGRGRFLCPPGTAMVTSALVFGELALGAKLGKLAFFHGSAFSLP